MKKLFVIIMIALMFTGCFVEEYAVRTEPAPVPYYTYHYYHPYYAYPPRTYYGSPYWRPAPPRPHHPGPRPYPQTQPRPNPNHHQGGGPVPPQTHRPSRPTTTAPSTPRPSTPGPVNQHKRPR